MRAFQLRESLAAACVALHLVLVQNFALDPSLRASQVLGVVVTILGAGGRHAGVISVHLARYAIANGAAIQVVLSGVQAHVLKELGLGNAHRACLTRGVRCWVCSTVDRVVDLSSTSQHSDRLTSAVPHEVLHVAQIGDSHRQLVPTRLYPRPILVTLRGLALLRHVVVRVDRLHDIFSRAVPIFLQLLAKQGHIAARLR